MGRRVNNVISVISVIAYHAHVRRRKMGVRRDVTPAFLALAAALAPGSDHSSKLSELHTNLSVFEAEAVELVRVRFRHAVLAVTQVSKICRGRDTNVCACAGVVVPAVQEPHRDGDAAARSAAAVSTTEALCAHKRRTHERAREGRVRRSTCPVAGSESGEHETVSCGG